MRFELTTSSLATKGSTTELHPLVMGANFKEAQETSQQFFQRLCILRYNWPEQAPEYIIHLTILAAITKLLRFLPFPKFGKRIPTCNKFQE